MGLTLIKWQNRGGPEIKILHFAHSFFPVFGGTSTRLYNLLSDKTDVHYLYVPQLPSTYVPSNIGPLKIDEDFGNIKVRRKYAECDYNKMMSTVEEDVALVHGHNPREFAMASLRFAEKNRLPFIYEAHSLMIDAPELMRSQDLQKQVKLVESKVLRSADAIIVQTDRIKQRMVDVFNVNTDKINVIPNGVDKNEFDLSKWQYRGAKLKKERNWVDKTIFMYSGFFDDINGIAFFLDSLTGLPKDIKKLIKIVILGRGPLQRYVEQVGKRHSDFIEYIGLVNYRDMPAYYSACDVFVVPRPSTLPGENLMPVKLLEAMAMEKTVLVSDVGAMTELVKNGKNGFVYKKGNKKDLLSKICYIFDNFEDMDGIKKRARTDIITRYSWEESRMKLRNIYKLFS